MQSFHSSHGVTLLRENSRRTFIARQSNNNEYYSPVRQTTQKSTENGQTVQYSTIWYNTIYTVWKETVQSLLCNSNIIKKILKIASLYHQQVHQQEYQTHSAIILSSDLQQEVKVIWQKAPHGGPIPRLGVNPGGRKLYHWIPGVGFPISVP